MAVFSSGIVRQAGRFGIVGILNTLIDFSIFNTLSGKRFKLPKIVANTCSTTVAMVFSFIANREAVFHAGGGNALVQAVLFFAATGFGVYVLQNCVLYLLIDRWPWPGMTVKWLLATTGLKARFSLDFTLRNCAKVAGTVVSLTWNFFLYKYVVFR